MGFANRLLAPHNGLYVTWFDAWCPVIDEALQSLPEMETYPHDLFRLLIQNTDSSPKKIALVSRQGIPVAVIPLRQLGRRYFEVSTWFLPGALFPAQPGFLIPALEALESEVWISWRGLGEPLPSSQWMRYLRVTPLYRIQFSVDYEKYWRETGQYKTIRNMRNRCKDFDLVINSPGSAEWTIKNAAEKWRDDPAATSRVLDEWVVSDGIVVAKYLENIGRHFTLMLLDRDTPIGGSTLFVHRNEAIGGLIYRKPGYEWYGIGVRLLDLCTSFSAESGFDALDLGGTGDYKRRWAPQVGESSVFKICPEPLFRAKQFVSWARTTRGKLFNWIHGDKTRAG